MSEQEGKEQHLCRQPQSVERLKNLEITEFSGSAVTFIAVDWTENLVWAESSNISYFQVSTLCRHVSGRCHSFLSYLLTLFGYFTFSGFPFTFLRNRRLCHIPGPEPGHISLGKVFIQKRETDLRENKNYLETEL